MKRDNQRVRMRAGLIIIAAALLGMSSPVGTNDFRAERPIAYVRKFKPTVTIQQGQQTITASKAEQLFDGDTLRTNENGFAIVQFMDKSIAKVKPNSALIVHGQVEGRQSSAARISMEAGEIFLNVTKRTTTHFEVTTGTSVASVKGTQFGARADGYYWVVEGIVQLLSEESGETTNLTKGMFGKVNDDGTMETGTLSDKELEELSKGYDQLEDHLEPKTIKLRFRDQDGQLREIELKYFEN